MKGIMMKETTILGAPPPCHWTEDGDGNWETDCSGVFCLHSGTPTDNSMAYCCYCGKPLVEVPNLGMQGHE